MPHLHPFRQVGTSVTSQSSAIFRRQRIKPCTSGHHLSYKSMIMDDTTTRTLNSWPRGRELVAFHFGNGVSYLWLDGPLSTENGTRKKRMTNTEQIGNLSNAISKSSQSVCKTPRSPNSHQCCNTDCFDIHFLPPWSHFLHSGACSCISSSSGFIATSHRGLTDYLQFYFLQIVWRSNWLPQS